MRLSHFEKTIVLGLVLIGFGLLGCHSKFQPTEDQKNQSQNEPTKNSFKPNQSPDCTRITKFIPIPKEDSLDLNQLPEKLFVAAQIETYLLNAQNPKSFTKLTFHDFTQLEENKHRKMVCNKVPEFNTTEISIPVLLDNTNSSHGEHKIWDLSLNNNLDQMADISELSNTSLIDLLQMLSGKKYLLQLPNRYLLIIEQDFEKQTLLTYILYDPAP